MAVLSKWYLDCVADDGSAFIGYHGEVRVGPLRLPYASALYESPEGGVEERVRMRGTPAPHLDGRCLSWRCPPLRLSGRWESSAPPLAKSLVSLPDLSVTWLCHLPRAEVHLRHDGTHDLAGLGYAEHLELRAERWSLPFHSLRWGRFLAPGAALVWIALHGDLEREWVFLDGHQAHGACFDRAGLHLPALGTDLELREVAVLRDGAIAEAILPRRPRLRRLLPRIAREGREQKWLSRGVLSGPETCSEGWAIHEVVTWH